VDTIIEKVDSVTKDDVQELADALFIEERFATVIIHPN
jgi:predicted Zn-dependent peptidase